MCGGIPNFYIREKGAGKVYHISFSRYYSPRCGTKFKLALYPEQPASNWNLNLGELIPEQHAKKLKIKVCKKCLAIKNQRSGIRKEAPVTQLVE